MPYNRKLSAFEQAMEILNRRATTYNIVTICRIKGIFSEEIFRQALEVLQARHPRLNCRIVGKLNSLRFETGVIHIPVRVVEKYEHQQWQEVALEELNQKIESHKSLMRVVLVRIKTEKNLNYLITTIHHAIADGLSCIQLHSELLRYCQKIASFEPIEVAPLPVLPPIGNLLPASMQGWKGAVNIFLAISRLLFKDIWYRPKTLKFEKFLPIEARRTGLVHRTLNIEQTRQLLNACRQNQTTVHSALCAAMVFASARKITAGSKTNLGVSCWSPINIRNRLKPEVSHEHLGVLVSGDISCHTLRINTSFWDLARNRKQQMEASIAGDRVFCLPLITKFLINFLLAFPHQVFSTIGVTNIGVVNIPSNYDLFELEEISFVTGNAAFRGLCVAVLTFESKMFLNFMFSEPAISQETAEVLVDNVFTCIVEASKNKKFTFADQMIAIPEYQSTSLSKSALRTARRVSKQD
ncbi:condensation domain-containing protein [Chlorogloeopsis sp. ULAP01]|uniref:phthiocerol/phthiodiolone dimycocerosyl transferase family protein n=1 Tax=Chlorogloeopsis sp. ULAP01 TaxID=3056483 RepID=UPI0025AB1B2E|nr:condensation domain-containing protein [Chlorogloeopsis sp. ULAP01]MDM9385355.1 condensation domain-containing protein [Chlorogloeopsis sp. ULAP01]